MTGKSTSGRWQVTRRLLAPILTKAPFEGSRGWLLALRVLTKSGEAELRFVDGPEGQRAVVGFRDGNVYVGERTGDDLTVWTEKPYAVERVNSYRIAWHGDVLVLTDGRDTYLGSVRPSWTPLPVNDAAIELAVKGEAAETRFAEPFIHPMR